MIKKSFITALLFCLIVLAWHGTTYAVGELLGLTVKVSVGETKQTYQGVVIEETVETIILLLDNVEREVAIEREAIQSIRLMTPQNLNSNAAAATVTVEPQYVVARQNAVQRVSTWRFFRDSLELTQTFLKLSYVQSQARQDGVIFGLIYSGLSFAALGVDYLFKPTIEARLFWRSQLPIWHNVNGFVGSVSSFGGDLSLAVATTQEDIPVIPPELGSQLDWFERAYMLYSVRTINLAIQLLYDGITMIAPPSN